MVREGMLVYGFVIAGFCLGFLRKGELPNGFAPLCRWASFVWVTASLWFLADVGGLFSKHAVILGIIPALYVFILPDLITLAMMLIYLGFGWPAPLRKQYLAQERARLDRALRESC